MLVKSEKIPDAEIDGVACFHYRGDLDMARWAENYVAKIIEQNPELAGQADFDIFINSMSSLTGFGEQIELWVGKDDYLMRQCEITFQYSDPSLAHAQQVYHYYYPSDLTVVSPVDSAGKTLPGWYLVTDSTFASNMMTVSQTIDSQTHQDVQIDLSNIWQQECGNVRVYVAASNFGSTDWIVREAIADSSDISLAPGEMQTYHSQWDFAGMDLISKRFFVEYTTPDGIAHVQLLSPQTG